MFFSYLTQKADEFSQPLTDKFAKEGKDKTVVFECKFSRPAPECKWLFNGQVSANVSIQLEKVFHFAHNITAQKEKIRML